jgi:uncharacterized membrane protein
LQVEAPQRPILKGDLGLVLKSKVKHAAISSRLNKPFVFSDKPLYVQYEVTMQVSFFYTGFCIFIMKIIYRKVKNAVGHTSNYYHREKKLPIWRRSTIRLHILLCLVLINVETITSCISYLDIRIPRMEPSKKSIARRQSKCRVFPMIFLFIDVYFM